MYTTENKMSHWILEWLIVGFIMGMVYFTIKGLWRIPQGGFAHIAMLPVAGLCGVLGGRVNQAPKFYSLIVLWQTLIGIAIVLAVELLAGLALNVWLGMNLWDYSGHTFNVMGQISPKFAVAWFFLIPIGIWLEDRIYNAHFSHLNVLYSFLQFFPQIKLPCNLWQISC